MSNAPYKNLEVWKKADELVVLIYNITVEFPKEEMFSLVSQMRRSAISVPANLVEGYGRRTKKDKLQFYYIARGSLNEVEYYIDLAFQLKYINKENHYKLTILRDSVGRLLNGFIKSI